ncbi:MAG: NAD(P)H-hydrate dehydratase [Pseudomonadota bacterium]
MHELIGPDLMGRADRLTIEAGTPGIQLMEKAGNAVAERALNLYPDAIKILVICGTGNNGGDGVVAARYLADAWRTVSVYVLGDEAKSKGDAAFAFSALSSAVRLRKPPQTEEYDLVIDAVFGAGLDRDVHGPAADLIRSVNESGTPVIAVDLPSGIDGATGAVRGVAIKAEHTVTFFRYKPGHVLLPGRAHCGERHLAQIGITAQVFDEIVPDAILNHPDWWINTLPVPDLTGHKYDRGHTLVLSGPIEKAGAARLCAMAALRAGSGLVTIASPPVALRAHAAQVNEIMLTPVGDNAALARVLADPRITTLAAGPGLDPSEETRRIIEGVLDTDKSVVLDAGALSAFEGHSNTLFQAIAERIGETVLTPHLGEFKRLFGHTGSNASKIDAARQAAKRSKACVVLKGADSIIADPTGRVAVNINAPADLASAGTGDVLTGIVAGLLAQSMPAFEAAAAAVWLHGDAGNRVGAGLIAGDLPRALKRSLSELRRQEKK